MVGVPAVSFKNVGVLIAPIKYSSISLNFPSQKASLCISQKLLLDSIMSNKSAIKRMNSLTALLLLDPAT